MVGGAEGPLSGFTRAMQRRGLERSTIVARQRMLWLFIQWAGGDPFKCTQEDIETFLDARPLGPRARYRWISTLHVFYAWAMEAGLARTDPTARVLRPRLRRLLPRPIAEDDLATALRLAEPRVRVMLLLAALAGFRCCEISRLNREDVLDSYSPPMLVAHGKGSKDRLVPMHPDVWEALRLFGLPRAGPVFTNGFGRRLSEQMVSQVSNQYLHSIGIADTMHSLRHRLATAFYRQSRDLRATQEILGHESPASTAIYTAWSLADAADVIGSIGVLKPSRGGALRP